MQRKKAVGKRWLFHFGSEKYSGDWKRRTDGGINFEK
jgi:hypothetical protein